MGRSYTARTGKTDVRSDKKSATGMRGSPKKGGHGGKWTWSGDGYSQAEIGGVYKDALDVKDPNYEDPEDTVATTVTASTTATATATAAAATTAATTA